METIVEGKLSATMLAEWHRLAEKTEPLGYRYQDTDNQVIFSKDGRIESVINELMPICDTLGLDVDDFNLVEYRKDDKSVRSTFKQGKIKR